MISDELIEKYKKLAFKIAAPYLIGFPKLYEDLQAATLLGLCEGLEQAQKGDHPNPAALIVVNVKYEIVTCLSNSFCIIRLPRSLIRKKRLEAYLKGEDFSIVKLYPEIFSLNAESILYDNPDLYRMQWYNIKKRIEEINFTELEEKVLVYRLSDYTYKEIAEFINYSDAGVIRIMGRVRKKWLKQLKR